MPNSKEQEIPPVEQLQIGDLFAALADPCRRLIVRELMGEPVGARRQCSSFDVDVSKSTMTHHFRILRESGLTIQYNHGNRAELELRRADLEKRFSGLLQLLASNKDEIATMPAKAKSVPKRTVKKSAKAAVTTTG
jgi:DNA-binding transcriptional ArsR family regulator